MATFPVVVDACVLYQAALRDTLLRAAGKGLFRVHWSDEILDEVVRNLIADGRCNENQAKHLVSRLEAAFPYAKVDVPQSQIEAMRNHEKDRHVAAAAVVADAKVIVTFNLKDFPAEALDPWFLEAQHPDEFLMHQFSLQPHIMADVICQQSAALKKNPKTPLEVLETLRPSVPFFTANVRPYI